MYRLVAPSQAELEKFFNTAKKSILDRIDISSLLSSLRSSRFSTDTSSWPMDFINLALVLV